MYRILPTDPSVLPLPDEMIVSPVVWYQIFLKMDRLLEEKPERAYLEIPFDGWGQKDCLVIIDGRRGDGTIYVTKRARTIIEFQDIGFYPEKVR